MGVAIIRTGASPTQLSDRRRDRFDLTRFTARALGTLGLGLLLSWGPAGRARADQLDVGKSAYHEMDYDAARVALLRAAVSPDPWRRAEAYLYLGLLDTVEGDSIAAERSFRSALVLVPALVLPAGTSPKVAEVFDRVKREIVRESAAVPPTPAPPPVVQQPSPHAERVEAPAPAAPPRQGVPQGFGDSGRAVPGLAGSPVDRAPPRQAEASPGRVTAAAVAAPAQPPGDELGITDAPPHPAAASGPPGHGGRWVAGALVVLGLAAVGVAAYYGVQEAAAEHAFATEHWQTQAVVDRSLAIQNAGLANILYVGGGVLGATGTGLWFAF